MANKLNIKSNSKRKNNSVADSPPKKLSKPVTQTEEEEGASSVEDFENFDEENYEEEVGENFDSNLEGNHEEGINEEFKNQNKQSSKESHQATKALRLERKANKPHAELLSHCKKIWEKMRNSKVPRKSLECHVTDMIDLLKGKVVELSLKHDASRIVQTCLKYGSQQHRAIIAEELKGHYLELAKAKYGHFIVLKILKYCKEQRGSIISEFYGNVQRLITQKDGSSVIEEAYAIYANPEQKTNLLQEFFGPEFVVFKNNASQYTTLESLLKSNEAKRESILQSLYDSLVKILNKGIINHSIIHHALIEYLDNANPAQIQEMIGLLKEHVVEILHTKDGSKVAMKCLLYGNVKDRKVIVKSFKPFVEKIAKEEYGHLVLLQLFDVVDDTVLVDKNIIVELIKNANNLLEDKFGRRAIAYLLVGRSFRYISKPSVDLLASHDEIRTQFSKKESSARANELNVAVSKGLIEYFEIHVGDILIQPKPSQILEDTIIHGQGDKSKLIQKICQLIKDDYQVDGTTLLEHINSSRVIKKLIKFEDEESKAHPYAKPFFEALSKEKLVQFCKNRGSFIILSLLESPDTEKQVKAILKSHKKEIVEIQNTGNHGADLIIQKLN
ncbi:ARM repeat-containing protein [Neoconidiobolus thromboides FSU 785]|nr:ARM repeat-containing protein [Neoconidiobolus thromboides FSU 785]